MSMSFKTKRPQKQLSLKSIRPEILLSYKTKGLLAQEVFKIQTGKKVVLIDFSNQKTLIFNRQQHFCPNAFIRRLLLWTFGFKRHGHFQTFAFLNLQTLHRIGEHLRIVVEIPLSCADISVIC